MEKMIMDDEEYISLCYLFQTNVKMAIGYCETLLTENYSSNFDNFLKDQISKSNPSSCQAAWSSRRLVIHCKECAISSSSCICFNCYNKEDHQNHHVSIRLSTGGNCSCGNPLSWKEEGFCKNHHAPDPSPETTQLTKELCDLLLIIFSAAFLDINFRAIYQPLDFIEICKWTKKLASVNDGYRRCIVIALLKKSDFNKLLLNIDTYDIDANLAMADLFMSLLCDKFFVIHFAQTCYKLQIEYVQMYLRFMRNDVKPKSVKPIINLTSHAYNPLVFTTILRTFDFDWIILIINFFQIIIKLLAKDSNGTKLYKSKLGRIASNVLLLAETGITMGNKNYNLNLDFNESASNSNSESKAENNSNFLNTEDKKRILLLFNSLITSFSKIEGMRPFTFLTPSEKTDFIGLNTFNTWISQLVYYFENTISPLFGDLVFTSIFRYFINFFIPDKFDSDKKITLFKRSIRGTALFTPIMPNHLFMSVLLYKNRTNLVDFLDHFINGALSLSDFTLLLSILPLRWLVACHSSMTRVIPVASRGINYLVKNFMLENMIIYSFSPTFALVQTCFALMPSTKEPFINVLSYLYSLYDTQIKVNNSELEPLDDSVKKNQRFAFLFMVVCLMTDNLCFERDIVGIGRAMLSVLLFSKPTSVGIITKTIAPLCLDKMSLSDELDKIAERVTTKKGNLFKLKPDEEKKCHPFHPWMKISHVINHMSIVHQRGIDCFNKDENENGYSGWFPQIRKSENGLSFADALETPTLKMWIYIILRDCFLNPALLSVESCDIIINLLIEMSKMHQNDKNESKGLGQIKVKSYDEFRKLINEQCQDFYIYMQTPFDLSSFQSQQQQQQQQKAENGNEVGPKFEPQETCFLSIVDIINKLGNGLFKSSLEKMGINPHEKEQKEAAEEEELKRKQKEKAKMLRDKIKNEFKMRMKNFTKNAMGTSAASIPIPDPKAKPDPITRTDSKGQHKHHIKRHHSKDKDGSNINQKDDQKQDETEPKHKFNFNFKFSDNDNNENNSNNKDHNNNNNNDNDNNDDYYNDYDYESSDDENANNKKENENENENNSNNNNNDNFGMYDDDDDDISNKASSVVCNICNIPYEARILDCKKDDELCYPCLAISTIMPSLIGSVHQQQPIKQLCFRICPHIVHASCCQLNDKFRCPVDRMRRNCLLPRLEHKGYGQLSLEEVNLIRLFRKNPLFFTRTNNQFESLVDSFLCSIVIAEVRLRMLPGCLDGNVNYLMLRNLFLMLWHSQHDEQMSLTSDKEAWDPLKSLVSHMIVSNDPKKDFVRCVNIVLTSIIKSAKDKIKQAAADVRKKKENGAVGGDFDSEITACLGDVEKELLLFLRRATLLEKLPLSDSAPSFIDWDEELSYKSLSQRFFSTDTFPITKNPSIQLDIFSLMKLPHEFLDLAKPPYDIPIDDMSSDVALCLLTGKLVSMERVGSSLNDLAEHLEENCLSNATLMLMVRGKKTSALYLAGKQFNMIRTLPSIYVDKFGDEDIGFERGELLFLNEERLERYTDMIISGEWTDLDMPD